MESEFLLLRQFVSNSDAEAFAKIIKHHAPMVYGVCLRILEDKDRAADAVQDTFLQLVRDAAEITGSLPNWLHRVATHRAIDLIRTDSQRKQREAIYKNNSGNVRSQNEKASWREISGYIDEELDNLDELTREVLILHFFEGHTMTCIGEKFGISQQTVSRRVESGIVSLRHKLKSRGVVVSVALLTTLFNDNIVKAAPVSIIKELGKIAIAGSKASISPKITTGISAAKSKIIATSTAALIGIGSIIMYLNYTQAAEPAVTNNTKTVIAKIPDVDELLDKYAQAVAKYKTSYLSRALDTVVSDISVPSRGYQKGKMYEGFHKVELHTNSKYYFARRKNWGDNPSLGRITEDQVMNTVGLWNGESRFQYGEHPDNPNPTVTLTCKEDIDMKTNHLICDGTVGGPIRGFFNGSDVTIEKELRHADTISVRPEKEKINDSDCFVIDAKDKRSEFVIWFDPEHDYNIVQAKIKRNSITASDPNNYKDPGKGTSALDLKNVVFKDMNGVWVPFECDYNVTKKMDNGDYYSEDHHHKITEYLINPDHDALRSFDPNSFLPNGAQVRLKGTNNCTWQDGKIIDSYGHEVDINNIGPISLMGTSVTSLGKFGVTLEPQVIKNRRLLVCFWDRDQRPSRNAILSLNKRAEDLLEKDLYMVFIHAGAIEERALTSWLKRNEILPPVGISNDGVPELGYSWGVQSLPWLILTDRKHIVTDEGFPLNELDEKLGKI